MEEDKKPKSRLKDNCYADMEVILYKGDDFEKAYTAYLKKRVAMAMRYITEYVENGGNLAALEKALFGEMTNN